ncbi:Glutathione hydrolase 1 proenzyme [Frankliniella fusca]|uniref:Glutathione hydrolase 1 proenzyme n=1 Tax=Frankliniella fusca TaxID=407009 RepID=A0AAE1I1B3_9NEOP|nr:Glutathione hydrolase 1 proenzyme [Frankliniella fusca]
MFHNWSRRTKWLVSLSAAAVIVVVVVLAVELSKGSDDEPEHLGAIATDAAPCQEVGEKLLRAGGNAVEVVIGILFCEGVASAQSMGLGGGFIMTIYDRKTKESLVINAREVAPAAATERMFGLNKNEESVFSGKAIAVPAELRGYQVAYEWAKAHGGQLEWAQLVEPTIKICEDGVPVIGYVEDIIKKKQYNITQHPALLEILSVNGQPVKKGDRIKRTKLAETLRVIAKEGADALHNGSLTEKFLADLKSMDSIVTAEDLLNYKPRVTSASRAALPGGYTLLAPPPPGSGPLLAHFLLLTAGMVEPPLRTAEQYQRIIEAMKFVYAARTEFGDPVMDPDNANVTVKANQLLNQTYVDEIRQKIKEHDSRTSQDPKDYGATFEAADPQGTAHVSVITKDMAVSVTSTVNTEYGSMQVSESTGIIMNSEMDDFSLPDVPSTYGVPPSPANFIKPGKIPQSSMAPAIILDADGDVRLVLGASGGPRITSAAGLVALQHLYLGVDLDEAIKTKRIHHQLMPMKVKCEIGFDQNLRKEFEEKFNHATDDLSITASSVMAIAVKGNRYYPSADARREGVIALIKKGE